MYAYKHPKSRTPHNPTQHRRGSLLTMSRTLEPTNTVPAETANTNAASVPIPDGAPRPRNEHVQKQGGRDTYCARPPYGAGSFGLGQKIREQALDAPPSGLVRGDSRRLDNQRHVVVLVHHLQVQLLRNLASSTQRMWLIWWSDKDSESTGPGFKSHRRAQRMAKRLKGEPARNRQVDLQK